MADAPACKINFVPDDAHFMRLALNICHTGIDAGQSPFGACIVRDGKVLACEHNRVWANRDATAHAEVQAIRAACNKLGEVHLEGATIYSTTEPCPMCFTAIHWTRIKRIVYAARVADAGEFGFNELPITNATMKQAGNSDMILSPDFLRDEAIELYRYWKDRGGKVY